MVRCHVAMCVSWSRSGNETKVLYLYRSGDDTIKVQPVMSDNDESEPSSSDSDDQEYIPEGMVATVFTGKEREA